jgi:hypothetical protein
MLQINRTKWVVLGALLCLGVTAAAGEKAATGDQDPYIKVALARAKAEIALRDTAPLFDSQRSGWNEAWQSCDSSYQKSYQNLNRARDEESRKPDNKNDVFINDCNTRLTAMNETWQTFSQKERPGPQMKMGDASNQFNNVMQAFRVQCQGEQNWKDAKMDLALLEQSYAALEKRALEVRALAEEALVEVKKQGKNWEDLLKDAENFVAAGGHPAPAPVNKTDK